MTCLPCRPRQSELYAHSFDASIVICWSSAIRGMPGVLLLAESLAAASSKERVNISMDDRRINKLVGQGLVIVVGPLFVLASMYLIARSADVVTESETIWSYVVFMVGFAAFAGGAWLWVKNR